MKRVWLGAFLIVVNFGACGASCNEISLLKKYGFTTSEARAWLNAGVSTWNATAYKKFYGTPEKYKEWTGKGYDYKLWKKSFETADDALPWLEAGLEPRNATFWKDAGLNSETASKWKEAGLTASSAKNTWAEFDNLSKTDKNTVKLKAQAEDLTLSELVLKAAIAVKDQRETLAKKQIAKAKKKLTKLCPNVFDSRMSSISDNLYEANPFAVKGKCFGVELDTLQILSRSKALYISKGGKLIVHIDFGKDPAPARRVDGIIKGIGTFSYTQANGAVKHVGKFKLIQDNGSR